MDLSKEEKTAINKLLYYNLEVFTYQLELKDSPPEDLSTDNIYKLLNIAEKISRKGTTDKEIALCLYICGIILENKNKEWQIEDFITQIFIRIGQNPTAKMVGYNSEKNKFINFRSIISELYATSLLNEHEVKISGTQVDYILSNFQKRIWDGIAEYDFLGLSAPTSAGKSFILIKKLLDLLENDPGHVIYVVPTLSLISQVTEDFRDSISELGLKGYKVSQNLFSKNFFDEQKVIYVATQERVLTAIQNSDYPFEKIRVLVIDEIQNLERLVNQSSDRPQILYDVIQEIYDQTDAAKVIFSGPLLKNLKTVLDLFFGDEDYATITEDLPPVINATYSFKPVKYKNEVEFIQSIPFADQQKITIEDKFDLKRTVINRKRYSGKDQTHEFIAHLLRRLNHEGGNLVFSKSSLQSVRTAVELANMIGERPIGAHEKILSLINYIRDTVHPDYELAETLNSSVAYHHGKVPLHIRNCIEAAFRERLINTIVCTTTLMQGVNLPSKNLIIRNPDVGTENLSGYEFANLRGRTGRLMTDLLGRAIILDEVAFEKEEIDVDEFEGKELEISYETKFEENKSTILDALDQNLLVDENKDLLIYIRQTALKYQNDVKKRLKKVGISIEGKILDKLINNLNQLNAPFEYLIKNRYWDPLDLELIYGLNEQNHFPVVPSSPFDFNFQSILQQVVAQMINEMSYYTDRYLNISDNNVSENYLKSLTISAENWAQGKRLKQVIDPPNWSIEDSSEIDKRINTLYSTVKYGIPKLLSPLVHIQDEENPILSIIELGAFEKETRFLIQMGLPRECSIRFLSLYNENFMEDTEKADFDILRSAIQKALKEEKLSTWDKIQVKNLI